MHFVACPKQGLKMEVVVLHRVGFLAYFCPKQGQDFKPLAAPLYPNIGQVPPPRASTARRTHLTVYDSQVHSEVWIPQLFTPSPALTFILKLLVLYLFKYRPIRFSSCQNIASSLYVSHLQDLLTGLYGVNYLMF